MIFQNIKYIRDGSWSWIVIVPEKHISRTSHLLIELKKENKRPFTPRPSSSPLSPLCGTILRMKLKPFTIHTNQLTHVQAPSGACCRGVSAVGTPLTRVSQKRGGSEYVSSDGRSHRRVEIPLTDRFCFSTRGLGSTVGFKKPCPCWTMGVEYWVWPHYKFNLSPPPPFSFSFLLL